MDESASPRPLYRQVYTFLVKQIADGHWQPGAALPSEQALANRLRVSQGTVRKALDVLGVEKVIERRQGKGTYVAEYTPERSLFRFFRLSHPGGARGVPTSSGEKIRRRTVKAVEAQKLNLDKRAQVLEVSRLRHVDGAAIIVEKIVVPLALFPKLDKRRPLPNTLYALYQSQYGVNVVSAEEELRADLVRKDEAKRLGLRPGAPILQIERVAIAVDGTRVEWRVSRCDTNRLVYAVTLS